MGSTFTLVQAVQNIETLDPEGTIYASKPWSADSVAIVAREPISGGIPEEAETLHLSYFLEVSIARDLLEDLVLSGKQEPSVLENCARLIKYANTDA